MNPDLILVMAIPAFLVTMLVEAAWLPWSARGRPYDPADSAASLTMGLGFLVVEGAWRLVEVALFAVCYRSRLVDVGDGALGWTVAILGWDFLYYWYHRAGHEVRLLWASHVNHHSSRRYNLSTALRQTWTPFAGMLFYAPLALAGVRPAMIVTAGAINLLYQYWIHTEAIDRLGAMERVFNTPSHHRVHHGVNPQYLDRNYGGILIVWDRLFGSFEPERERPIYGLTKNIETFNPLRIAFHEYAAIARDVLRARDWRERLGYVLRYPGWRPAAEPAGAATVSGAARGAV
jgi:sterol desaturase/sphingolipid hydroxylase (fatty acid hydroxylase superfamily)